MVWKPYIYPNLIAIEQETNTAFHISVIGKNPSFEDLEITPAPGSKAIFSEEKLYELKKELWVLYTQERTRNKFRQLLDDAFQGNCQTAAIKLTAITGKPVSNRTVQAWLIEPGKKSSRKCPEWALKALKENLEDSEFREELELWNKSTRHDLSQDASRFSRLEQKDGVRIATNQIDSAERRAAEWKQAGLETLPNMLYAFERETQSHIALLQDTLFTLIRALENSRNYDEFKTRGLDAVREVRL